MLQKIRSGLDNTITRILVGSILIIISFIFIKDSIQYENSEIIVTFKDLKPIKLNEFLTVKNREIAEFERSTGVLLSQEEIKRYQFDEIIIEKLITERLITDLCNKIGMDLSSQMLISILQKTQKFNDDAGKFDLQKYRYVVSRSGMNESQYLEKIKHQVLNNALINILTQSIKTPQIFLDQMIDHLLENREVTIAYSTTQNDNSVKISEDQTIEEKELREIYDNNIESLFTIPEKRDVYYAVLHMDDLIKNIKVSDVDIESYFKENKEDAHKYSKAEIHDIILETKINVFKNDLFNGIEESIAAGKRLDDIAKHYNFKLNTISSSYKEVQQNNKLNIISKNIFEANIGEVSDLMQLDNNHFILFEIKKIVPLARIKFEDAEDELKQKYLEKKKFAATFLNAKKICTNHESNFEENLSKNGFIVNRNIQLNRNDIKSYYKKYPEELIDKIFKTNDIVEPMSIGDKIFVAKVYSVSKNSRSAIKNIHNIEENGKRYFIEMIFAELIYYLKNIQNIQINHNILKTTN